MIMKKIGIFYWPLKGSVEQAAKVIANKFDGYSVDVKSLDKTAVEDLFNYDYLVLGIQPLGLLIGKTLHRTINGT